MQAALRRSVWLVAGLAGAFALTGCGKSVPKVVVRGRLLDNGKPLQIPTDKLPPGDPGVRLEFCALRDDGGVGDVYTATVDKDDATFEVKGHAGKGGIPVGKYRVAISVGPPGQDRLKKKFTARNSTIEREITTAPDQEIVIDVAKPTG
jgi:hypothetical protein